MLFLYVLVVGRGSLVVAALTSGVVFSCLFACLLVGWLVYFLYSCLFDLFAVVGSIPLLLVGVALRQHILALSVDHST